VPAESYEIEHFIKLERAVWQALKDGDATADARLLSDDFRGVYRTGMAAKSDHLAQLQRGPSVAWYELSNPEMMVLGEGLVALSYFAHWARAPLQSATEPESMVITSIWRLQQGAWKNVFSQDTDLRG
jgi:hypothetical protein